jgi:hypothetical protein
MFPMKFVICYMWYSSHLYVECGTHVKQYLYRVNKKIKKNQIQNLKSIFTKLASVYCQKLQRSNDKLLDSCDDNGHL